MKKFLSGLKLECLICNFNHRWLVLNSNIFKEAKNKVKNISQIIDILLFYTLHFLECSKLHMRPWTGYYVRWDPRMKPYSSCAWKKYIVIVFRTIFQTFLYTFNAATYMITYVVVLCFKYFAFGFLNLLWSFVLNSIQDEKTEF